MYVEAREGGGHCEEDVPMMGTQGRGRLVVMDDVGVGNRQHPRKGRQVPNVAGTVAPEGDLARWPGRV